MSERTQRLSYPWTTGVITCLVVLGAAVHLLRPLIPDSGPNKLAGEPGDFLESGVNQAIDWYPVGNTAFREARRRNRPIFMVIGNTWSRAARYTDISAFSNREVRERLRQEFICIRIDGTENPEWMTAYLPLSRSASAFDPSFQIHFLDSSGHLLQSVLRTRPEQRSGGAEILQAMSKARELLEASRLNDPNTDPPGASQAEEVFALNNPAERPSPDFAGHLAWIRRSINPNYGGLPVNGFQTLPLGAWRFLVATEDWRDLDNSLTPVLLTPMVDWVDGGFFRQATTLDWRGIETDKLATQSAAMMTLLARVSASQGLPLHKLVAERAFDGLIEKFAEDGLFIAARVGDEGVLERSKRYSLPSKALRQNFSPDEREWLRDRLGLRVETNPQMIPMITSPEVVLQEEATMSQYIDRIRGIEREVPNEFSGKNYLDVNGYVVARLLETSRFLGDTHRMSKATAQFNSLARFRVGDNDVVHDITFGGQDHRILADYLAFADAAYQYYLTTGNDLVALEGFKVLQRAIFLFSGPQSGVLFSGLFDSFDPPVPDVQVSNLIDGVGESTTAAAIRLCYVYGCMFRNLNIKGRFSRDGEKVYQMARSTIEVNASAANIFHQGTSSFFDSAMLVSEDLFAVVVGPDNLAVSQKLQRSCPHRVILPASGEVRPVLGNSAPGIYILHSNAPSGPFSLEAATKILSVPCRLAN